MKNFAFAIVAAAGIAAPALAQTTPTSAAFDFEIVPQGAAAGLTNGGSTSLSSVTFWVRARATTAAGTNNYGINRWLGGLSSTGGTLSRATSSSSTRFGRFAAPAPRNNFTAFAGGNSANNSATGNAATPSTGADVNGRVAGAAITGIDAYNGFQFAPIAGTDPIEDPSGNPLAAFNVTDGSPSLWANLYSFTVSAGGFGQVSASFTGNVNMIASIVFQDAFGGNWFAASLNAPSNVAGTFSFNYIPTPGAAALLGLGGIVAGRRRR